MNRIEPWMMIVALFGAVLIVALIVRTVKKIRRRRQQEKPLTPREKELTARIDALKKQHQEKDAALQAAKRDLGSLRQRTAMRLLLMLSSRHIPKELFPDFFNKVAGLEGNFDLERDYERLLADYGCWLPLDSDEMKIIKEALTQMVELGRTSEWEKVRNLKDQDERDDKSDEEPKTAPQAVAPPQPPAPNAAKPQPAPITPHTPQVQPLTQIGPNPAGQHLKLTTVPAAGGTHTTSATATTAAATAAASTRPTDRAGWPYKQTSGPGANTAARLPANMQAPAAPTTALLQQGALDAKKLTARVLRPSAAAALTATPPQAPVQVAEHMTPPPEPALPHVQPLPEGEYTPVARAKVTIVYQGSAPWHLAAWETEKAFPAGVPYNAEQRLQLGIQYNAYRFGTTFGTPKSVEVEEIPAEDP